MLYLIRYRFNGEDKSERQTEENVDSRVEVLESQGATDFRVYVAFGSR